MRKNGPLGISARIEISEVSYFFRDLHLVSKATDPRWYFSFHSYTSTTRTKTTVANDYPIHSHPNPASRTLFSLHETRHFKSDLVQQRIYIQEVFVHFVLPSGNNFLDDNHGDQLLSDSNKYYTV